MRTAFKLCLALLVLFGAGLALSVNSAHAQAARMGKIAFVASGPNGSDILVRDLDNNVETNLTQGRLSGIAALAWSPDGSQLVISADRGTNLYVVGADGANLRSLTHNTGPVITQTPTWSPDGTQIAFIGNGEQNYDVFLINADGSNGRRLTNTNSIYRDLAWSPDGSRIAYSSGPDFFNVKIHVMNSDGSAPRQLSGGGGSDVAPAWSQDGSRIAYENDFQFGPSEIFVMNADGSGQTRLTDNFRSDRHPTWSPDGSHIAFSSDREGDTFELYVMRADGSNPSRVTNNSTMDGLPVWRPDDTLPQATPTPTPVYSVSGNVSDLSGAPVAGVLITFELDNAGTITSKTTQTDAAGNYSSGELGCQNGVSVTPSKPGYGFSPQQLRFVSTRCLTGSNAANFLASSDASRYTISGRVTDGGGNAIGGAFVTLGGTQSGTIQADPAGNYSFPGLFAGGNYTLTATKEGQYLKFTRNVDNLSSNLTIDLTLLPYVSVNIHVVDGSGNGLAGVGIYIGNSINAPLTNSLGNISVNIGYRLTTNSVTLTPRKYGYTFGPPDVTFDPQSGNKVFNFTGILGNNIDDSQFFVRQHYLDFFNREPDAPGLQFWTNNITSCGSNIPCFEVKRIDTSAAFFLSVEFQQTGYLVHRLYKAAYGDIPGKPVPITLQEFLPDTQSIGQNLIVNSPGWEAQLEANKRAFTEAFVNRGRFTARYPTTMPASQYVDALNANTGNSLTQAERDALVNDLTTGAKTRHEVLRQVAENQTFSNNEKNRAFVLIQYFGYLRRNPDDAPNTDFSGYNFWLGKLNSFGGDFRAAEMVKAFITSGEYRGRFGPQ